MVAVKKSSGPANDSAAPEQPPRLRALVCFMVVPGGGPRGLAGAGSRNYFVARSAVEGLFSPSRPLSEPACAAPHVRCTRLLKPRRMHTLSSLCAHFFNSTWPGRQITISYMHATCVCQQMKTVHNLSRCRERGTAQTMPLTASPQLLN